MQTNEVRLLEIPLYPLSNKNGTFRPKSKRIRPKDSLNLTRLVEELRPNILGTWYIDGHQWSVISVYSPYSPDVHVMTVETTPKRFLPAPEWLRPEEGNTLVRLWQEIIAFIIGREQNDTVYFGYNWSPRSWGREEETTGFQSVPTKWHPQIWGWPPFPHEPHARFVPRTTLLPEQLRLIESNEYGEPFGQVIGQALERDCPRDYLLYNLFPRASWSTDKRGFLACSSLGLAALLSKPSLFSEVIRPVAVVMERITRELTELLTTVDCNQIDELLLSTERAPLRDDGVSRLRATPSLRSDAFIHKAFNDRGYPRELLAAIYPPIKARCTEEGKSSDWWRKGFGYALVIGGLKDGKAQLRIMPGVYMGAGGVVEAQGAVLTRPEKREASDATILQRSKILWALSDYLRDKLGNYVVAESET